MGGGMGGCWSGETFLKVNKRSFWASVPASAQPTDGISGLIHGNKKQHKYFSSPYERWIDRSHSCSLWIRIICRTKWEITLIPPALLHFIPSSIDLCERKELCRKHIYSSLKADMLPVVLLCMKGFSGRIKKCWFLFKESLLKRWWNTF